jgi:rRNA maturation protein Nop10
MKLMRCQVCGDYTMQSKHHDKPTVTAHPISSGVGKHVEQRVKMRARKDD